MEAIAMAVLGGVSTAGGKGRVVGVLLGVFTNRFVTLRLD